MTQLSIPQAMNLAMQQHRGGNVQQAESIYRQILAVQPDYPDALHMLGLIAFQSRQFDVALELIGRALQIHPQQAGYHANLGQVLAAMGRTEDAMAAYRQALAIAPDLPEANNNLANLLRAGGQMNEAIACYRKVVSARPDLLQVWINLAETAHMKGDMPLAAEAYQHVLAQAPSNAEAWNNLGNVMQSLGHLDHTVEAYEKALGLRPNFPEAHQNLGQALVKLGRLDQAIAAFRQAIALRPDYAEANRSLGNALRDADQIDQSIAAHNQSIQINSNSPVAHSDLGNALRDAGQFDEAIAAYRKAISVQPDYAPAHFNLGLNLLLRGELREGWAEHDWRWRINELGLFQPFLSRPKWTGDDLAGRAILLHAEQGFGDSIQFARFVPLVARRGGKIILYCQPELTRLFKQLEGVDRIISPPEPPPEHDVQCALMSLPGVFDTTLETIPADIPYLRADPELSARWRERAMKTEAWLRVGLAWSGRKEHTNDRRRSLSLAALAPLLQSPNVVFFGLGKEQVEQTSVIDLSSELTDFADTAALIDNLDLVISVDTAVAHLAGAMGKPVWTMLPFIPDWRWLLGRDDSPWYPTMKLFRQPRAGDWSTVVEAISKSLETFQSQG